MRFLEVAIFFAVFTCAVSKNVPDYIEWLKNVVNRELQSRYSNSTYTEEWIRYIEGCFDDNGVYHTISSGKDQSYDAIKRRTIRYALRCETAATFYNDFKTALNQKFPNNKANVDKCSEDIKQERVFEKNCFVTCDSQIFLNQHIAKCSQIIEATSQNTGNYVTRVGHQTSNTFVDSSRRQKSPASDYNNFPHESNQHNAGLDNKRNPLIVTGTSPSMQTKPKYVPTSYYDSSPSINPEESKKIEEDRKQTAKEKFYADLAQSLSQWYPNREEVQRYLMNVSRSNELRKSPRPDATLSQRNIFEDNMTRILDYPNHKPKVQKDIKDRIVNILSKQPDLVGRAEKILARLDPGVELYFLDDEALGNQAKPAVQAALDKIFDEFMRTLENNLEDWYRPNSQYYLDIVYKPKLAWKLCTAANDSETNKYSFKRNMIVILNSEPWNAVRVEALKQRIEKTLMKQYPGFKNYHKTVLHNMENDVQNKLEANLIFDDAMLEEQVQIADQVVRSNFSNNLRSSIESWYPNSNEIFNSRLIRIAETENFYLKDDAETIESNKSAFEHYIKPILKRPEYATDVANEIKKRVGSMFAQQNSPMQEYEEKVVGKFLQAIEPQSQADLLFDMYAFMENLNTAIVDTATEIQVNAYAQLRANLNNWLPNSQGFVEKYILFIMDSRYELADMKKFDKIEFVFSGMNIRKFAANDQDLVDRTIQNEVKGALKKIDPFRVDRNLELLKIEKPNFLSHLSRATDLENQFQAIFSKIKVCVDSFDSLVDDLNFEQDLKGHLKSNECVRDELCVKTKGNIIKPEESLQLYIEAFNKLKNDSQATNKNIKDEIDETIYDVIETLLSKKQNVEEEAAKCFVNYLRREDKIDPIYSSPLLFNEGELAGKIKAFQEEYEEDYKRIVKNR